MSTAQYTWQKANTRRIELRLNRNQDGDIIDYLAAIAAPQQYIRRLIREEIARTGWKPQRPATRPAALSLDGGTTWITPDSLPAAEATIAANWDAITAAMDPQLYEDIDTNYSPCPLPEFVAHYLERSGADLIADCH